MTPFTSKIFDQPLVTEPVAHTQDLYAALDPVVQAVLTDKNADIDKLLDAANAQVQDILEPLNRQALSIAAAVLRKATDFPAAFAASTTSTSTRH